MALKHHYFLAACQVLYAREGLERTRNFNVMLPTENAFINRKGLGLMQQQAQVRFYTEFDTKRTAEIKDVFILGISSLGEMSEAEFHFGYEQQMAEEEANGNVPSAEVSPENAAIQQLQDELASEAEPVQSDDAPAPAEGTKDTQS